MKTMEQELAAGAYTCVANFADVKLHKEEARQQYGGMAHKLPVLVHTAGLVQALTFVDSRNNEAHQCLLDDLANVLGYKDRVDFLKDSRELSLSEYMYLSRRTILALTWFKRFAQSILEVEVGQEDTGGTA